MGLCNCCCGSVAFATGGFDLQCQSNYYDPKLGMALVSCLEMMLVSLGLIATSGNLSVQLDKLQRAGYIEVRKEFVGKRPRTTCSITDVGRVAFETYVSRLRSYLHL